MVDNQQKPLTFLTKVLSELLQFVQVLLIHGGFGVCQ